MKTKTYYIEFFRKGYAQEIIKVKANSLEEAQLKAMKAFVEQTVEIVDLTEKQAKAEYLDTGIIPIDENGEQVNFDEDDTDQVAEEFISWITLFR